MKRIVPLVTVAAASLLLAACNEPSELDRVSKAPATPAAPPALESPGSAPAVPAPAPGADAKASPQVRLEADMELSSKVKDALKDPGKSRIEVAANDGVVTLYGTVESPADKDRIALAAMEVEGVRSVVNNLVVMRSS